jgi:hypothetical protein
MMPRRFEELDRDALIAEDIDPDVADTMLRLTPTAKDGSPVVVRGDLKQMIAIVEMEVPPPPT